MAKRFDLSRRLEPMRVADARVAYHALRADTGDPLWLLGRQWSLGEHRGDDAAFPSTVHITTGELPITGRTDDPHDDPRITPPEVIVESEPEQWWTIGRRVRVGSALTGQVPPDRRQDPALTLGDLPPPHHRLGGAGLDGLALYRGRADLGLADALFHQAGLPLAEPVDDWRPDELRHDASFSAGAVTLDVPDHRGDEVDWFSASARGPVSPDDGEEAVARVLPGRVTYPGAPGPRWWQIADRRFDVGALPPQRTHLAALLLAHVVTSHGDDWFTAPVVVTSGSTVVVRRVEVTDSMGLTNPSAVVEDWSLYRVSGLGADTLTTWPTAAGALTSPVTLDQILVGVDEDANLLWAIEQRVGGAELPTGPAPIEASGEELPTGQVAVTRTPTHRYVPSADLPPHWHPYVLTDLDDEERRVFVQGRLADLTTRPVTTAPGPVSRLLRDRSAPANGPDHVIDPSAIPSRGVRLVRRYRLARRTDGLPALWIQRRSTTLAAPPASSLRFDELELVHEVVTVQ